MDGRELSRIVAASKAIIFDLFYTLTSLDPVPPGSQGTAEILGLPRDLWTKQMVDSANDRFAGKERNPFEITRRLAHAIDPQVPEEKIRRATAFRLDRFKAALVKVPAVTEQTISALRSREKKTGLVSNADVVEMAGWAACPIASLFDSVVFSCEVGYVKPQREIYEISMRELDIDPAEGIFVGDGGSKELHGAREVGLTTVMITGHIMRAMPQRITERSAHADFVIETLDELLGNRT